MPSPDARDAAGGPQDWTRLLPPGWHVECVAEPVGALFRPRASCRFGDQAPCVLPPDTEPYTTAVEAIRHAQQQVLRHVVRPRDA